MNLALPRPALLLARACLLSSFMLSPLAGSALAQDAYPSKAVKLIVNFPAGGPLDILARSLGNELQQSLKQPFVVENKPGAAGNIGADAVAKAEPDGYTVLVSIDSVFTVNPHIYKKLSFNPAELKPLMVIATSGLLVGTTPRTGFKTLGDLVAAGKKDGVNFSSAGSGSPGHLAVELFKEATGMKITQIPYKGNNPAVMAILSDEVDGGILATPGMLPHVKAGKITALAVTSHQRSKLLPDVPTVAEAGFKDLEQEVVYLVMVPTATPDAVQDVLRKGMVAALDKPEVKQRLNDLDLFASGITGTEASRLLAELSARYERIIRATGMHVE